MGMLAEAGNRIRHVFQNVLISRPNSHALNQSIRQAIFVSNRTATRHAGIALHIGIRILLRMLTLVVQYADLQNSHVPRPLDLTTLESAIDFHPPTYASDAKCRYTNGFVLVV